MARARLISKSLGSSERFFRLHSAAASTDVARFGLTEFAGELYMLLITASDDFGRFHGDAFTVKMQVFPASPRRVDEFDIALGALVDAGLIQRYRYNGDGKLALQIVDFEPHQQGLQRRTRSAFPPPDGAPSDPNPDDSSNSGSNGASLDGSASSEVQGSSENLSEHRGRSESFAEVHELSQIFSPELELELEDLASSKDLAEIQKPALLPERGGGGSARTAPQRKAQQRRARAETLLQLYRDTCPRLRGVHALTDRRIASISAALDRNENLEQWRTFFARLNASTFCTGGGEKGWVADFDFALRADTWAKTFEGAYDDRNGTRSKPIRTADDARAAVRERGIAAVSGADVEIDLR
jgi:hypothetical protein